MSSKAEDEVIKQYYTRIQKALKSKDKSTIKTGFYDLCALLSKGYSITEFDRLISEHVVNDKDSIEILSQMLMVYLVQTNKSSYSQANNLLFQSLNSPKESRRIRATKTLGSLADAGLIDVISSKLLNVLNDESSYVKKAAIVSLAHMATEKEVLKPVLENHIKTAFANDDQIYISGAIYACDILNLTSLIADSHERLWSILLSLDPFTQSIALKHLISTSQPQYKPILKTLLHSPNANVVISASKYFQDDPEPIVLPLLRLLYCPDIISLHSLQLIEQITRTNPQLFKPYLTHFSPPQTSSSFTTLCINILRNVQTELSSEILLKWALYYNNQQAVHCLGEFGDKEKLLLLLRKSNLTISEISAFYLTKFIDNELLANIIEMGPTNSSIISVITDTCKDNIDAAVTMLNVIIDKFDVMNEDTKNEAALLAVRTLDCDNGNKCAKKVLELCEMDKCDGVARRANALRKMMKIKNAVWQTREPPKPVEGEARMPKME
ncbi:Adaptin N terminal region family protein [Histomonas meleagridis]|uniref:Adaptin N terminal region family protein n=1 Tax=Histomonas meleagridis TaxID=135588 RepID=UPI003559E7B9|nr:Adaptin N terminal region family protein [Histomonas meleagridis]KAH0797775.1 Adaptin N terminal region family protein [Histomonas meleagridis]